MQAQASSSQWVGPEHWWVLALGALMIFAVYRRFRRNFGRQRLRPAQMGVRAALLGVIGIALLPAALRAPENMGAIAAGIAIGLGLGAFAAERTRFETHDNELHYIPHTYAGILVSALFLGRIIYRWAQLYSGGALAGTAGQQHMAGAAPQSIVMSPLTLGLLFVLISYNAYYGSRVLGRSRHLRQQDIESSIPS